MFAMKWVKPPNHVPEPARHVTLLARKRAIIYNAQYGLRYFRGRGLARRNHRDDADDQGVVPTKSAADLVEGLAVGDVVTLATTPSASLTFDTLLTTLDWATTQVERGARGVVIVQGTDTLEETAYFFDCLWPFDAPVVVTGAMRNPALPRCGRAPAQLAAAVTVAGSPNSSGRGSFARSQLRGARGALGSQDSFQRGRRVQVGTGLCPRSRRRAGSPLLPPRREARPGAAPAVVGAEGRTAGSLLG